MKSDARLRWPIVFFLALVLGLTAGYQSLGVSRDYKNYFAFFDLVRNSENYWTIDYRFEPGFTALIYWLVNLKLNNAEIYSIIAGCAILIKYSSIEHGRRYWAAILVFTFYFFTRYLILFEMTVLRAACAFSLAFFVFIKRKTMSVSVGDIMILVLGTLFHYSAIVFVIIYLIRPTNKWRIIITASLTFLIIYILKRMALTYLPQHVSVFLTYSNFGEATLLPIPLIADMLFLLFALLKFENSDLPMRYAMLGMGIGLAFHFSLLDYSMIGGRFNELLSVFFLVYVVRASICEYSSIRHTSLLYSFGTGLGYFYLYKYYEPLLS